MRDRAIGRGNDVKEYMAIVKALVGTGGTVQAYRAHHIPRTYSKATHLAI